MVQPLWVLVLALVGVVLESVAAHGQENFGGFCGGGDGTPTCAIGICSSHSLCGPCEVGTCETSLACSLDGTNTICAGSDLERRLKQKLPLRESEAPTSTSPTLTENDYYCTGKCTCAANFCNSDNDCGGGREYCQGGNVSSMFGYNMTTACSGTCVPALQLDACGAGLCTTDVDCGSENKTCLNLVGEECGGFCNGLASTVSHDRHEISIPSACPDRSCSSDSECKTGNEFCLDFNSKVPCSGTCATTTTLDARSSCMMNTCSVNRDCIEPLEFCSQAQEGTRCSGLCIPMEIEEEEESSTRTSTITNPFMNSNDFLMTTNEGVFQVTGCAIGACSSDSDCSADSEFCFVSADSPSCSGVCLPLEEIEVNGSCTLSSCTFDEDCNTGLETCVGGGSVFTPCSGSCLLLDIEEEGDDSLVVVSECSNSTCRSDLDCITELEVCDGMDTQNNDTCSGVCISIDGQLCPLESCNSDDDCIDLTAVCQNATDNFTCSGTCESIQCPVTDEEVQSCSMDNDCLSGLESCQGFDLQFACSGTCSILAGECPEEVCSSDADCSDGVVCRNIDEEDPTCSGTCRSFSSCGGLTCSTDGDCRPGLESCEGESDFSCSGNCTPVECPVFLSCGRDADCQEGLEQCQDFDGVTSCSGVCLIPSCREVGSENSCSQNSDCNGLEFECIGFDGERACTGQCVRMPCPGETCSTTSECIDGQKCSGADDNEPCSGSCETFSLRFRNYRGEQLPNFGKGFDFGTLFFTKRTVFVNKRRSNND